MSYLQKKLKASIENKTKPESDDPFLDSVHVWQKWALESVVELIDQATCKNCRHSEQYENKNGWMMCHGIVYDGGDVEGAMIDGDVGSMFVKPDFSCAGFEPRGEE